MSNRIHRGVQKNIFFDHKTATVLWIDNLSVVNDSSLCWVQESLTVLAKSRDDCAFRENSVTCGELDLNIAPEIGQWSMIIYRLGFSTVFMMQNREKNQNWNSCRWRKHENRKLAVPCCRWFMRNCEEIYFCYSKNNYFEYNLLSTGCWSSPNFTFFSRIHGGAFATLEIVGKFLQIAEWADDPESGEWVNSGGDSLSDFLWNCVKLSYQN